MPGIREPTSFIDEAGRFLFSERFQSLHDPTNLDGR
jgi:hypothetical protein